MTPHANSSPAPRLLCRAATLAMAGTAAGLIPAGPATADARVALHPHELGQVGWKRDFNEAVAAAKTSGKPVLVLFQEVPGCSTCVNYGNQVLSHPLVVEAAETLFVPTAVLNNVKGDDERTLLFFKEPAWNNPVVRIVSADRRDLVPRLADDYSVAGLAAAMVAGLKAAARPAPAWLDLLAEEESSRAAGLQRATFAMHCFWEGEGALGNLPGVVGTRAGFLQGQEVVEIEFDPARLSFEQLVRKAGALKCASTVFARTDAQAAQAKALVGDRAVRTDEAVRPDSEPKYYLSRSPLRYVPMTGLQACRVNAALGRHEQAENFLSPRQLSFLQEVRKAPDAGWPSAIGVDVTAAWKSAHRTAVRVH